jgi:hypothetical protein
MRVFAIISPKASEALDKAVKAGFPENFYVIAPGQYLVAAPGLVAKEVGAKIGDRGEVGQVLVLPLEGYWGWHRKEMWDWASARAGA